MVSEGQEGAAGDRDEWPAAPGAQISTLPLPAEAENEPPFLSHARAVCADPDWGGLSVLNWNELMLEELSKNNPFGKSAMYAGDEAFAAFLQGVAVWRAALSLAATGLGGQKRGVHPCRAFALAGDEVLAYIGL